jgi:hypothetical protein
MRLRHLANRLRRLLSPRELAHRRPPRRTRLGVEALEEREVPAIVFSPHFGQETTKDFGGTKLSNVPVYVIFSGDWNSVPSDTSKAQITSAVSAALSSPYLSHLTPQYGSDGHAHFAGSLSVATNLGNNFSTTALEHLVEAQIDNGSLPRPDLQPFRPLFVVVTPPGVNSNQPAFGYHLMDHYTRFKFPFVLHDDVPLAWVSLNSSGVSSKLDGFTSTFSHEVAESMSDADPDTHPGVKVTAAGAKYPFGNGGEIGDNEPGSHRYGYRVNGVRVQPYWSQNEGAYVVADGSVQKFVLDPQWSGKTFLGKFVLYINGDQLANKNDNIVIDTTAVGGVQVTLNGETATFDPGQISAIQVNTGKGTDSVLVRSTLPGVNVTVTGGANSNDTVTIGKNGSLAGIAGNVTVNSSGHTALVVDDHADKVARHGVITSSSVTGLSAGTISYVAATSAMGPGVTSVTIDGGQAANKIDIQSTAAFAPVSFLGGVNSKDVVTVGKNGSLSGIAGNVTVQSSGQANLVVDDSKDLAFHNNVVLTDHSVTGLSQGAINYTAGSGGQGVTNLNVYGSKGGDHFEVKSLSSNTHVNLFKGKPSDVVVLDGIFSNLHIF